MHILPDDENMFMSCIHDGRLGLMRTYLNLEFVLFHPSTHIWTWQKTFGMPSHLLPDRKIRNPGKRSNWRMFVGSMLCIVYCTFPKKVHATSYYCNPSLTLLDLPSIIRVNQFSGTWVCVCVCNTITTKRHFVDETINSLQTHSLIYCNYV